MISLREQAESVASSYVSTMEASTVAARTAVTDANNTAGTSGTIDTTSAGSFASAVLPTDATTVSSSVASCLNGTNVNDTACRALGVSSLSLDAVNGMSVLTVRDGVTSGYTTVTAENGMQVTRLVGLCSVTGTSTGASTDHARTCAADPDGSMIRIVVIVQWTYGGCDRADSCTVVANDLIPVTLPSSAALTTTND